MSETMLEKLLRIERRLNALESQRADIAKTLRQMADGLGYPINETRALRERLRGLADLLDGKVAQQ